VYLRTVLLRVAERVFRGADRRFAAVGREEDCLVHAVKGVGIPVATGRAAIVESLSPDDEHGVGEHVVADRNEVNGRTDREDVQGDERA